MSEAVANDTRGGRNKMPANAVSAMRYIFVILVAILTPLDSEQSKVICFILITLAGFTDFLDGFIARRTGPTRIGAAFDPLADEFAVITGFICLLYLRAIPLWFALMCFWSRSLFSLIRLLSVVRGEKYAAPQATTKTKMAVFYFALIALFALTAFGGKHRGTIDIVVYRVTLTVVTVAVVVAVIDFAGLSYRHILVDLFKRS